MTASGAVSSYNLPTTDSTEWIEYDYAVVRLMPLVHIGVFINIGILMHARRQGYLKGRFDIHEPLVRSIAPCVDLDMVARFVRAWDLVAIGGSDAGELGMLPPSERFHWLTSPRSTMLQTSPVHPGRTRDLEGEIRRLLGGHCTAQW